MKMIADRIAGYTYGSSELARSTVSLEDLESLKVTAGWSARAVAVRPVGTVGALT